MNKERTLFRQAIAFGLYIILSMWFVKGLEWGFNISLSHFGILPREVLGAVGIFTSPFIHGDFLHLLSNSFSLFLLIILLFFFYDKIALRALLYIYILTGGLVWIIARDAYHIGASGIIYGIASFILFSGLVRKNQSSLALSFIILLLYGGMFYGVLPAEKHISWESHLMGLLSGLLVALILKDNFAGQAELKLKFEKQDFEEEDFLSDNDEPYNLTNTSIGSFQYTYKLSEENDVRKDAHLDEDTPNASDDKS